MIQVPVRPGAAGAKGMVGGGAGMIVVGGVFFNSAWNVEGSSEVEDERCCQAKCQRQRRRQRRRMGIPLPTPTIESSKEAQGTFL